MNELNFARSLAQKAGLIMVDLFAQVDGSVKTDGTIVTEADMRINRMVIDAVKTSYPDYSVLGEEESYMSSQNLGIWVCDPIDGTLPYSLGVPTSVFSLSLLDGNGMPIVAVVYDPFLEKIYWATKNGGAFENGLPLQVSSTKGLKKALIGNSGRSSTIVDAPRFKAYLYAHCHRPVVLHSFIYEAMLVASGKIAATVMTGSGAYDAASVKLIVEEAGGKVTDLFGEEQRYDRQIKGAIASNSSIHQEIVAIALRHRL